MEPSTELLLARRKLEEINGYEMLEDLAWDANVQGWTLKFRLTISISSCSPDISDVTEWYTVIPKNYPWGKIDIYPARQAGITMTFQHQNHNNVIGETKWRSGKLCLDTTFGSFSLRGFNSEPMRSETRLLWHTVRCKLWLEAAAAGQLVLKGQPFELPAFPLSKKGKYYFSENDATFVNMLASNAQSGLADVVIHPGKSSLFISSFKDFSGKILYTNIWNESISGHKAKFKTAIWLRLNFIPVSWPWEAPITWGKLYEIGKEHRIDLNKIITETYEKSYRYSPDCLLLGFPIPEKIGEDAMQIHWQPLALPTNRILNGFRPGKEAKELAKRAFQNDKNITWMDSQNGNINTISARGKIAESLSEAKILLIGAGAVGSIIAECLVRGTCHNLTIMDKDRIELGNMSRHTLTLASLDRCKAQELSKRLNEIFPASNVSFNRGNIEQILDVNKTYLQQFDLIIDATGSDQALHYISEALLTLNKKFVSVSLGMNGNKLFQYQYQGCDDIESEFKKAFSPWLNNQIEMLEDNVLPREGIGCWHPLFPARVDDVWMMSSACIKLIESYYTGADSLNTFIVIEQRGGDMFEGLKVTRS